MAFESLSRGAVSAVLVEQNRQAVKYINKTSESLEVVSRLRVLAADTFRVASTLLAAPQDDTPWIVFLCPPYILWEESLEPLNQIIQTTLDHAPPGSVLVAETEKKFDAAKLPAGEWDFREYGGTRLAFIEPAMRCGLRM
jgi:16S rRNA (guanine966-N2)-methyltransferase